MREERKCNIDDCTRTHYARGMCRAHYNRWRANGSTEARPYVRQLRAECAGPLCDREAISKGLCGSHYYQMRNKGVLSPIKEKINKPGQQTDKRYCAKCDKWKPLDNFYKQGPNGYHSNCIECHKARNNANNRKRKNRTNQASLLPDNTTTFTMDKETQDIQ